MTNYEDNCSDLPSSHVIAINYHFFSVYHCRIEMSMKKKNHEHIESSWGPVTFRFFKMIHIQTLFRHNVSILEIYKLLPIKPLPSRYTRISVKGCFVSLNMIDATIPNILNVLRRSLQVWNSLLPSSCWKILSPLTMILESLLSPVLTKNCRTLQRAIVL